MNPTKEDLWRILRELLHTPEAESLQEPQQTDSLPPVSYNPAPDDNIDLDLSHPSEGMPLIPDAVSAKLDEILDAFEQLQIQKEQLADELLTSFTHLNVAFSSTVAVARNKNIHRALQVLIDEIAHAVGSQYSFYTGPLTDEFALSPEESLPDNLGILRTFDPIEHQAAREFFQRYQTELQPLIASDQEIQVRMIDYHGQYDLDHEGRGNVLVIHLRGDEQGPKDSHATRRPWELEKMGTLIFVRTDNQQPFLAVEMNLAATLCRMGAAVLGNIIYAHKINKFYLQTIASLVRAMEAKDEYTSGHSNRVAEMACELGRYIGLDPKQIEQLEWAGLLHDIGKIGIRDDVLCKPGKLTDEEFAHIKTHPVQSYKVLEPLEALQDILGAVRHHHEHYDGKGYPDGLAGEEIPLHARILQVADVWDALTSTRSYRTAMPPEKAQRIMREEAGTTMDPRLVAAFMELLEEKVARGEPLIPAEHSIPAP